MELKDVHLQTLKAQWQQMSLTSSDYHDRKLIVEHIEHNQGSATWMIAACLEQPTNKVRRVMRSMEADGIVVLCDRYTTANNLVWQLAKPAA